MTFKQILILVVLGLIAIAVAYFFNGVGYTLCVVATAVFCWLIPFKTWWGWVTKGVVALDNMFKPKVAPPTKPAT